MYKAFRRRLERLEQQRQPTAHEICEGIQRYRETGVLPADSRLAEVVRDFVDFAEAADATFPSRPDGTA